MGELVEIGCGGHDRFRELPIGEAVSRLLGCRVLAVVGHVSTLRSCLMKTIVSRGSYDQVRRVVPLPRRCWCGT